MTSPWELWVLKHRYMFLWTSIRLWLSGQCLIQIKTRPNNNQTYSGLIPGLRPVNERRRYFVTTSLIGWAQAWADSRLAPSQLETAILCNDVSHWLGASLESTLPTPAIASSCLVQNVKTYMQDCFLFVTEQSLSRREKALYTQWYLKNCHFMLSMHISGF